MNDVGWNYLGLTHKWGHVTIISVTNRNYYIKEEVKMKKNFLRRNVLIIVLGIMITVNSVLPAVAKTDSGTQESYQQSFDAEYYYNTYPDLQQAIGNDPQKLYEHYITFGIKEGRSGRAGSTGSVGIAEFNLRGYIQNNPDLMTVFREDYGAYYKHYVECGKAEGRLATPVATDNNIIGTYSTNYIASEQRAINIQVAASRINGVVVEPGATFSFSKTILPRTTENGYVVGPAYSAGKLIESIGGGICQVSSTLYATLIHAAISSTERYAHSGPVTYLPKGLDATIAGNSKDLKFKNSLGTSITILAEAKDGVLTISLQQN